MRRLENRVAVVTGAGSGIGRATSLELAQAGCELALVDLKPEPLAETAAAIERLGRRATWHVVDVSSKPQMRELVDRVVREHGSAHVLVNNAGVAVTASFEDHTIEDFEWLIGINLWGVIYGCKFFLPVLREADEAHIVNISSVFGFVGMPLNSSYCASKFAVRGFSESLRAELNGSPIGVTSVHPGGVATNIVRDSRVAEKGFEGLHQTSVQRFKKMLPPEEAARAIVRGIRRNAARVLITREAYLIDILKRLFPVFSSELVGRHWRRVVQKQIADTARLEARG